jgi:hypothetical protein
MNIAKKEKSYIFPQHLITGSQLKTLGYSIGVRKKFIPEYQIWTKEYNILDCKFNLPIPLPENSRYYDRGRIIRALIKYQLTYTDKVRLYSLIMNSKISEKNRIIRISYVLAHLKKDTVLFILKTSNFTEEKILEIESKIHKYREMLGCV